MKMLSKFIMLCSLVLIFSSFAMSIDVTQLVNKAKERETGNENKIGSFIRVEILQKETEPKQIEATYYKKGVKTRSDTSLFSEGKQISSVAIYDGKDYWMITGKMKIRSPQNAGDSSKDSLDNKRLADYLRTKCKIERAERINGRGCYVVSAAVMENSATNGKVLIWIDKENYVTRKQLVYDKSGNETMKTIFLDFKEVCEGVSVPFTTEVYMGGKLFSRSVIKSFKINQKLSDDLFDASKFKVPELGEMMKKQKEIHKTPKK
jgi:outer membrane lipoprotein-sorting protein